MDATTPYFVLLTSAWPCHRHARQRKLAASSPSHTHLMCGLCLPMQGGAHHKHARVREVAVHISNYTMRREDRGAVVVGGSIEMGDLTGWLHHPSLADVSLYTKLTRSCSSSSACMAAFVPVTAVSAELDRKHLLPTRLGLSCKVCMAGGSMVITNREVSLRCGKMEHLAEVWQNNCSLIRSCCEQQLEIGMGVMQRRIPFLMSWRLSRR